MSNFSMYIDLLWRLPLWASDIELWPTNQAYSQASSMWNVCYWDLLIHHGLLMLIFIISVIIKPLVYEWCTILISCVVYQTGQHWELADMQGMLWRHTLVRDCIDSWSYSSFIWLNFTMATPSPQPEKKPGWCYIFCRICKV